eukprot:15454443-Alexandrium_andersonii.AAC.2
MPDWRLRGASANWRRRPLSGSRPPTGSAPRCALCADSDADEGPGPFWPWPGPRCTGKWTS